MRADFDGNDYVWSWETRVSDPVDDRLKAHYRQSSFFAQAFGQDRLRKRADTFVPHLDDRAHIDRQILELMATGLALGEIAQKVRTRFPDHFGTWEAALTRVGDLSTRYSR